MAKQLLKKTSFWFALMAMTSVGSVYAVDNNDLQTNCSSGCGNDHRSRRPNQAILRLYNSSIQASALYTENLGLTLLWSARPYADSAALVAAYNEFIAVDARILQNVFSELGAGVRANGVALAFVNLALQAQALAGGTGSLPAVLAAASALSNELIELSPRINPVIVNTAISSIVNSVGQFIALATAGQFGSAEANCRQAINTLTNLVAYIDSQLSKVDLPGTEIIE